MKSLNILRFGGALLALLASAVVAPLLAQTDVKPVTTNTGSPVGDNQNSQTAGQTGGVLLQDIHLIEKLAAFDRERIPERVVHARGAGAYGEFTCYDDFSRLTKASLFAQKGKVTPVFVRFSTVIHGNGSPETMRDPRGFATKFYTDQGNYDLVGNNLPVFFIRDAMKFPDMVHALKPSPITNRQDPNRIFDFFSNIPEATHMFTFLLSDYGTPANYRQMEGNGVHAFKWVNAQGEYVYVKYKWVPQQTPRNFTAAEAAAMQAKDIQHATSDLYDAIRKGDYPAWELQVQVIKASELDKFDFYPLDPTKIWPEKLVPSVKVGRMVLNRIPNNFFEEVEQAAFSPGTLVPGIEPSEDRLLQGRLFSYFDTQRHRMGANFQRVPVNAARVPVNSTNQDGALSNRGTSSEVNYQPSARQPELREAPGMQYSRAALSGSTQQAGITKTLNFAQAGETYRGFSETEKANLIANLAGDLSQVTDSKVVHRMVSYFYQADTDFGQRLIKALKLNPTAVTALIQPSTAP